MYQLFDIEEKLENQINQLKNPHLSSQQLIVKDI